MPLELTPTRLKNTLYLRIPKDIKNLHNITAETPFTLQLVDDEESVRLVYKLPAAARKKREKEKEKA